ncbi:signal transduction histidine kinase [Clostridiales Family XIII bacterium PM5-7]
MNLKSKFDFKSIRFKLWIYFIGFALLLIGLIWMLQTFFLNNYYEAMKIQQTTKLANRIIDDFKRNDQNLVSLAEYLQKVAKTNSDVYIRVETGSGAIITPDFNSHGPTYLYGLQAQVLANKLKETKLDRASVIYDEKSGGKTGTLSYACYLHKATDNLSEETNFSNSYILYIFSPLYPMESTVAILRAQLIYITLIAALLALALAIYLANRISRPIKRITNSAAEMGKGHYGVIFKGGHYSEISDLADTLTNASRELEKTDMYQKDLIANVSHDLRTPLTMIKSYAEMVRDLSGNNPEKREVHLNVIIEEADRLNTLVNDMLNMSRMQSKEIILEKSDFNIKHTVETLLASYEILAESEGYQFKFSCPAPILINGDESKIKQVLANLLNNAVKYCGEDKEIIINLKRSGRKMRCEVIDHGAGIAPDEISHVWERYYKSSTHHVRPTDGSGLGLSIVREILSLHKAEYGVISKLGKGSTFWFEMDIVKANRTNEPRLKAR